MLVQRCPDLVPQHPLSHPVDEHNSAKLFTLGNVHHAVKVIHLNGQFGAIRQAALVVHQFVNVEIHFHVCIPSGHARRL